MMNQQQILIQENG
jgi:hypothetical protein